MIKKLFSVVTGVLALNFLLIAAGAGYLVATHKLDRAKVHAVRDLLLSPATQPTTQPSTQPATQGSPDDAPMLRLGQLLDGYARRPSPERVEAVHAVVDNQAALVERRAREVEDQRGQVEQARADLARQREAFAAEKAKFEAQKGEQAKLAGDAGFQQTLAWLSGLPPKQAKTILSGMDDATVVRYLQQMDDRQVAGLLKEFKTPAETKRAQTLLERVRQPQATAG